MFHFWEKNYSEEDRKLLKLLKNILGCKPKNISVYKLALIHRSRSHKDAKGNKLNNERLEYLGDTVLSTIVGEFYSGNTLIKVKAFSQKCGQK